MVNFYVVYFHRNVKNLQWQQAPSHELQSLTVWNTV